MSGSNANRSVLVHKKLLIAVVSVRSVKSRHSRSCMHGSNLSICLVPSYSVGTSMQRICMVGCM